MADNTVLSPGVGGDTIASDDIGGIKFPRGKLTLGADGTNDGDVSASNPLPVTGALTDTQLRATPVPISGTVTANAGTNLNTSTLALEAGGNLAAAAAVLGVTSGAAVITDANGAIQQYLRGIVKLAITAGGFLVTATVGAGSALIGKVGIDQTTVGVTNAVTDIGIDPSSWKCTPHISGVSTQGTTTKASAGGSLKNVALQATFTLVNGATPPTVGAPLIVSIIDGASGGTTYLWRSYINIPAVAGAQTTLIVSFPKGLPGATAATALTAEFSAALTNSYQSVSMSGITSL